MSNYSLIEMPLVVQTLPKAAEAKFKFTFIIPDTAVRGSTSVASLFLISATSLFQR